MAGAACSGDASTEPEQRITAELQCVGPTGQMFACELSLASAGGFQIELSSTSCQARGNTVRLTKPTAQVLTADGCYETSGREWTFTGPYAAGTEIGLEVEAVRFDHLPTLRVTGAYPTWQIEFEDGFDDDFDDLVLNVRAL